jgi:hypothetical protein
LLVGAFSESPVSVQVDCSHTSASFCMSQILPAILL